MRKNAILVGLFSLAGCLLHGDSRAARAALDFGALWTTPPLLSLLTASPKTKQFSSDEYEKLRAQALMKASLRLGPNIRNPNFSRDGLDADVVGTLLQQRTYLERPRALIAAKPTATKFVNSVATATASCPVPVIRTVNGKGQGAIFTPQPPNNLYRIEGCSFGKVRGQVQLEPHPALPGQSAIPIALQIDDSLTSWSENEIDVRLDPRLSGIRDSPVTLVIYPGKGQRMELSGCFFVAARAEPQLLSAIPSSWVKLDASTARSHPVKQLEYVSPPAKGGDVPSAAAGTSAFVIRFDSEPFTVGRDVYDFSHLNPGWVVDSVQLQTYSLSCPGLVNSTQSYGNWVIQWGQHTFAVALKDDFCTSSVAPSFAFSMSLAQYAANVWVVGPVGTQPVPSTFLGKGD
jgi:hypothetical protein